MAVLNQELWVAELYRFNPWWRDGKVPARYLRDYRRAEYDLCYKALCHKLRRTVVLSGARRVGKTTIVYQIIDELLSNGVEPARIFFFTLDLATMRDVGISDILAWYRENFCDAEDFYLFIDEIQNYDRWQEYIKLLYDRYPGLRCVVTGSASSRIEGALRESGSGRWTIVKVPTFSFFEYCLLKGVQKDLPAVNIFRLHELSEKEQNLLFLKLSDLTLHMTRYLQIGGFPEYFDTDDADYARGLLYDQVMNRTVRQDIASIHNIRNTDALERLFLYLCAHTSEIINIDVICRELRDITKETVKEYIRYFCEANLLLLAPQLNAQGKKTLKAKNKAHIADCGIRWALIPGVNIHTNASELGICVETMVYKHLQDYCARHGNTLRLGFVRDNRGAEIDIAIYDSSENRPVQYLEAKMRADSRIRDNDGIVAFPIANTPGYVITKKSDDFGLSRRKETSLFRVPATAFLYLTGQATAKI